MSIDKIKAFFKNKETVILIFLSLALTVNSIFFVALKMKQVAYFYLKDSFSIIFFIYFLLSVLALGTIVFFIQKFDFKKIVKKILWTYLPTEIILLYGIDRLTCNVDNTFCLIFNNILPLATVIYFILLAYLIVDCRKKPNSDTSPKFMPWIKKQGWLVISVVLLVFILNLGFGSYHLTQKAVVDEALWTFDRIPKFWNNVLDGEWQKTQVSDKPGITVALTSGIGLLWTNPKEYKKILWQEDADRNILHVNFLLRFPILLFSSLMLFVFYFFIEKLLGKITAVTSIIFIGLSPILLGISTIINPDALLWIFLPLSMLSYFIYKKNDQNAYLYWAGIFLGLSLLTKYVSNILYVFFFLLIFSEYVFNQERYANSVVSYLKKSLKDYLILIFFSLLTFLLLLPAAWVEISRLLKNTLFSQAFQKVWPIFILIIAFIIFDIFLIRGKIISSFLNFLSKHRKKIIAVIFSFFLLSMAATFVNTYSGMKWLDFESILASPKSAYLSTQIIGLFLANFYSLIFGILPLAFVALIFLAAKNIWKKTSLVDEGTVAVHLITFIILYYLASSINNVSATVRYQIVIYPIAFILAAIGVNQFLNTEKIKKYIPAYLAFAILLIFSVYSLNFIKPFYLSYASDALPQKYVLNLKDMGDGSFEAAQYLNSLPDAKDISIWTDKNGVCVFFVGKSCTNNLGLKKNQVPIDYFVISAGRESRTSKMTTYRISEENKDLLRLDKLYGESDPEWNLELGGRPDNFVRIIKAEKANL